MNFIQDIVTGEIFKTVPHPDDRHVTAVPVDGKGMFTVPKNWIDGTTAFRYLTAEENSVAEILYI